MATAVEPNMNEVPRPITPKTQRENEAPLPPVPADDQPSEELDPAYRDRLQHVLSSDIGMSTLLSRLKQSISSTKDFAAFLKERSVLEEKHAQGLKRLSRSTHDSIGRPESRQGSFAQNYKELTSIHERMADHGLQYCNTIFAMSEELHDLAASTERARKNWKQTGLSAEKRVQDAEAAMEKAKHRYNSLAEQYDRARTGERQSGKFGLKKSAAQAEEDLRHKLEASDADYAAKVEAAQSQRNDLMSTHRPQTVKALQELIMVTDAGLSAQVQQFANLSEKLLLGFGLCVTPMKGQSPIAGQSSKSLREVASSIDNERDFVDYVLGFSNKAPSRANEIKYEKHPSLSPKQQQPGFSDQYHNEEPYAQSYPPTHGRQVSGVTPYQGEENYDEYQNPEYGQQPQIQQIGYPPGNQGPGMNRPPQAQQQNPQMTRPQGPVQRTSGPPQLPQIGSSAGGQFVGETAGAVSPMGADGGQPPVTGPGHVRNISSIGSLGAPVQQGPGLQPMRSSSPQPGPLNGQAGQGATPQQMGVGRGQAPMGRGQAPQGMGRGQAPQGMGRGQPQGMGRGQAPLGGGRSQAPPGAAGQGQGPQDGMNQGQAPQGGMIQGQLPSIGRGQGPTGGPGQEPPGAAGQGQGPQGGMNQGQALQGGMIQGQLPSIGRGQGPTGGPGQGPAPQGAMGRGQPPQGGMGRGAPQSGMGRGQPPQGMGRGQPPQGMVRGQAPQGSAGMGQPQGPGLQQNMPPQGAGRGMTGPGPNGPPNGTPRPAGGVNVLPSRQAAQRGGPPVRPVFGVSLDELFQREGSAVPIIVMQCVQAVDMYGLNVEGIYRTSGSANHIMELRQQFDHDANMVDFRSPSAFYDDIASVTTLLKHFLRDLPDSLLTAAQYRDLIHAAKLEEDVVRRDSIHALVNALPDPNYATLRVLAIHLHRVAQHSDRNKMTNSNLAIVFAPTLMGQQGVMNGNAAGGADIADAGWQAKVVETILNNTFQIFDADE